MGSREQALIREFPNGETHLRSLLFRRIVCWMHNLAGDLMFFQAKPDGALANAIAQAIARSERDAEPMRGAPNRLRLGNEENISSD